MWCHAIGKRHWCVALGLIAAFAATNGCQQPHAASPIGDASGKATAFADGTAGETSSEDPRVSAALARLDAADRELASAQRVCPVTGQQLGSLGMPQKVRLGERDVFICCPNCREELLANPDLYLARLGGQGAAD